MTKIRENLEQRNTEECTGFVCNSHTLRLMLVLSNLILVYFFFLQMAYELRGLLENNISIVTGENIRPSYGGDDEAFLKKVVTPIYRVIERVYFSLPTSIGKV
jgi:hypothetical protein